jgi:Kdo2-lipid IVA lauroyltransferase/acyltransferase
MSKTEPGLLTRVRYRVEYTCVRALSGLLGLMPEAVAVWTGKTLGRAFWLLSPWRRRVARENIEKAMPGEMSPADVRRLVRRVFVNIGLTAVETLWMRSHVDRDNVVERFPIENLDAVESLLTDGRGVLLTGGHLGNWELLGGSAAVQMGRMSALARPVNNPLVGAYTTRLREHFGIEPLSTREGVRPMMRALKGGHALAILMDQHVNRSSVPATFFGRDAATTAVVATLALRMDVPLLVSYGLRDGYSFRHRGYMEGPFELRRTGDQEADVLANTQMLNDKLEGIVRRHPDQWLWTHRRWKLADRKAKETD